MRFFIIFYLSLQMCFAGHNVTSTNSGMSLKTERIDTKMDKFISDPRHIHESDIEPDWYKRDENNELLNTKANYTNNILKILIKQLVENFSKADGDRIEQLKNLLEFLNKFISERFIPTGHQEVIKKVFNYIKELQHKPKMHVTNLVFNELSEEAQKAFRDQGVRVQTNGIEQSFAAPTGSNRHSAAPTNKNTNSPQANPVLLEILFLQLVWNAQKLNGTRQELLNHIEKCMVKMEHLFGRNDDYTIVGTFESLRASLIEYAQKESPLPDLIRFIISIITENKKDLEKEYSELLSNKEHEEWKKIISTKAKTPVSIWIKNEEPKELTEAEKHEHQRKKEKSKFKDGLNDVKKRGVNKIQEVGISAASQTFDGLIGGLTKSLSGIFG